MDRRILHLDIDAFLASVEQLRDPSLYGRPVAVGTGVVASRSYEAKARGVATAMPLYEALRRCPDLVVRAGDARLCERYRQRVAETLRQFAPVVEVCSLDDFYADLTGVPLRVQQALCDATASDGERSLRPLCEDVRAAVRAATGCRWRKASAARARSRGLRRRARSRAAARRKFKHRPRTTLDPPLRSCRLRATPSTRPQPVPYADAEAFTPHSQVSPKMPLPPANPPNNTVRLRPLSYAIAWL